MSFQYKLIDELAIDKPRKPPWNPRGLFFLTLFSVPAGAIFFFLNWGRLGLPEKRLTAVGWAVLAILIPKVVGIDSIQTALHLTDENHSMVRSAVKIAFAFIMQHGQTTPYNLYILRGGKPASSGILWVIGLGVIVLAILRVALSTNP